jgi:hypothetical protein
LELGTTHTRRAHKKRNRNIVITTKLERNYMFRENILSNMFRRIFSSLFFFCIRVEILSRKSIDSIVTRIRAGRSRLRIPAEARNVSLLQIFRTGHGAHIFFY